ncbi:response regulator transcription factor [Ktedonosporobacter rubrisoli]|uniref:Response regulator transcription factor n=1 Tax=Ktedonosporobacter rubrisoli TaxID=2509675 RepID=A0A4P6K4T1_KTERU|nr:response regulator transcription factor [Ktedonosporobacter rubrisoli]QBD83259.1 response regulator transcription factor [Ktedonosporobacter rubrisoli]
MKLLVVDSDRNMVEMLTAWLKILGYQVLSAYSGEQARNKWLEHKPDFVILESALQDLDVLAMCRDLRSQHDALVMVITAGKDVLDEVRCLESGIDDYLRKPFFPDQLLAHIHAVTRRARSSLRLPPSSSINVGPLCIDPLHNTVTVRGKTIRLTPTEGKLLSLLATNANDVCTANQIVSHVWGFGNAGDTVLIKTHIYHLRQKIEPDPANPRYILAIPGIGYKLVRRTEEMLDSSFGGSLHSSLAVSS